MPFLAHRGGTTVVPEEVADPSYAELVCPACRGAMYVRSSYTRGGETFVARHFYHAPDAPGDDSVCNGGESEQHRQMKSIALSKLKQEFPGYAEAGVELTIRNRRADVALSFPETNPHPKYGEGIVAEVQHKNEQKDTDQVTKDFLKSGYSVFWLDKDDFDGKDVTLTDPVRARVRDSLPEPLVAVYEHNVPTLAMLGDTRPVVPVKLPTEFLEQHRDELWEVWKPAYERYKRKIQPSFIRPDDHNQMTFDSLESDHEEQ